MDHSVRNLVVAILSWVAEGERQNLSERTKAEVTRARQCVSTSEDLFGRSTGTAWDEYLSKEIVVAAISRLINMPCSTWLRAKFDLMPIDLIIR